MADELSALFRRHRARVVANLARTFGIDAAEEGFQEAAVKALAAWTAGVPREPAARLTTAAKNHLRDALRHQRVIERKHALFGVDDVILPETAESIVFNEGYAIHSRELMRLDLQAEALRLGRLLGELMPRDGEVAGLYALMAFAAARARTRVDKDGILLLLSEQDRSCGIGSWGSVGSAPGVPGAASVRVWAIASRCVPMTSRSRDVPGHPRDHPDRRPDPPALPSPCPARFTRGGLPGG